MIKFFLCYTPSEFIHSEEENMRAEIVVAHIINGLFVGAYFLFIIISIVRFIQDSKEAKKENRSPRTGIKVRFIISMVLLSYGVLIGIFMIGIATGTMRLM